MEWCALSSCCKRSPRRQHRCHSASSGSSGNHSGEHAAAVVGEEASEGKNVPRRQQWQVSPELVRQISRSYRNLRDESVSETVETSTHETTVREGRRRTSMASVTSRKDHLATSTIDQTSDEKTTRTNKVLKTEELKSKTATSKDETAAEKVRISEQMEDSRRAKVLGKEQRTQEDTKKTRVNDEDVTGRAGDRSADISTRDKVAAGDTGPEEQKADDDLQGTERRRLQSRSRPRTTLRLEGRHEYSTTSSDYFKDTSASEVKRAVSGVVDLVEPEPAAGDLKSSRKEQSAQEESLPQDGVQRGGTSKADSARSGTDVHPARPRTSLRMEGSHAHTTTTSEDYKAREQTEKVSRRLRPKKFDDPSYQVEWDEEKAKKRRVDLTEVEDARKDTQNAVAAQQIDMERREAEVAEDHQRRSELRKYVKRDVHEEGVQTEDLIAVTPATRRHQQVDFAAGVPTGFDIDKRHKRKIAVNPCTSTTEIHPWNIRGRGTCLPKDNLEPASGDVDYHTTNQMEYYRKRMERVRPVKPKSLAMLFSSGSSTDEEVLSRTHRGRRHQYGGQKDQIWPVSIPEYEESSSAMEDTTTRRMARTHPDTTPTRHEPPIRARRFLKPYALEGNLKFEGDTDFTTTSRETYKEHVVYERVRGSKKPQNHDIIRKDTRIVREERFPSRTPHTTYKTSEELNKIRSETETHQKRATYGRKDSAELIAEIQGLMSGKDRRKRKLQRRASVDESSAKTTPEPNRRTEESAPTSSQGRLDASPADRTAGQEHVNGRVQIADEKETQGVYRTDDRSRHAVQAKDDARKQEIADTPSALEDYGISPIATTKKPTKKALEPGAPEGTQKPPLAAEMAVPVRPKTTLCTEPGRNGRDFSTTTGQMFGDVTGASSRPSPIYPRSNITTEGDMDFRTVSKDDYGPKTVTDAHVPVRPLTTLRLSEDRSYVIRNTDKIGYTKELEKGFTSFGDTHYRAKRPTTTLRLGHDSPQFETTTQKEYKRWETTGRDRAETKTYSNQTGHTAAAFDATTSKEKVVELQERDKLVEVSHKSQRRHRKQAGISELTTVTQSTYLPATVERPQPYRPRTCLKIRCETDTAAQLSTTTRETYRKVTPTARVKPIRRETCIHSLGDDDVPMSKVSMSGEAFCPLEMPPKLELYRPTDNLQLSGEMSFSTTTNDTYFSHCKQDNETLERVKPIRHDTVMQNIIFPTQVRTSSASSQESSRSASSRRVLKSVENVADGMSSTRLSKQTPQKAVRTGQRIGCGASMRSYDDPKELAITTKTAVPGRYNGAGKACDDKMHCPAARLNTDSSEYVFKEAVGKHRFYLPVIHD